MDTLTLPSQKEAVREIHDRVRQYFTRHKFAVYGDALSWWHKATYETQKLEAGEQGMSKFATDILWLISLFGPKKSVDYSVMASRKVPALKSVKVLDPDDEAEEITDSPKTTGPRKKTRHRKRRF